MGNTVGTAGNDQDVSDEEAERLFREKIGYISIIKNRKIRSTASGNSIPFDLVSSIKGNSHSWATSSYSEVTTPSTFNNTRSRSRSTPTKNNREVPSASTASTGSNTLSQGTSTSHPSNGVSSYATSGTPQSRIKFTLTKSSPHSEATEPIENISSGEGSNCKPSLNQLSRDSSNSMIQKPMSRSRLRQPSTGMSHDSSIGPVKAIASKGPIEVVAKKEVATAITTPEPMTEAILQDLKKRIDKEELEKLGRCDGNKVHTSTMKTIEMNEVEIAKLKQQILILKSDHNDASAAAHTETTSLLRKVTSLQSHLKVVERERDAALAAGASTATPKEEELKESIKELLKQVEDCESDHQREEQFLRDEVMTVRKKLERLESEYIVIERERDSAVQRLSAVEQRLQLEKGMAQADLKKYSDELSRWRERYRQELRFTKKEADSRMQKTAVVMGTRLSAGILEGIQEDEELIMTSDHNGITTARLDDDSTYSRLVGRLRSVASPVPMMDVTSSNVNLMSTNSSFNTGTTPGVSTFGWSSTTSKTPNNPSLTNTFDETISIPSFLSKVW